MSQATDKKVKYTKRQKAQWYRAAAKRLDQQKKLGIGSLGWFVRSEPNLENKCFCTLGALAWVIPHIENSPDIYIDQDHSGQVYRDSEAELVAAMHVFNPSSRVTRMMKNKELDVVVSLNDSGGFQNLWSRELIVQATKETMATYMRTVARVLEHGGKLPGATSSQSA